MTRIVLAAALLVSVFALASAAGGGTGRSAAGPSGSISALVVLKAQAALPASASRQAGLRRRQVVRALRDAAAREQRPVLQLLSRRRAEGRVTSVTPLWILNGILISAKPEVVQELAARADVREVRLVRTLNASDSLAVAPPEPNVSVVNAPALWDLGHRGAGVVVASLDTGVDGTHPDLSASWRGGTDSWFDPYGQHPTTPVDLNGHGTWTMGTVVGGDAGGAAVGVAPGAKWIAAKIFNDEGVATTAAIHEAFQWLLDPDGNPSTDDAPDIVNGSWTMGAPGCDLEFQLDLQALRAAGVAAVFAAGNGGPDAGTSYSPANNPEALSVGASDLADSVHSASSRGPSACGGGVFPHVVAPGVNVRTADLYGGYVSETGTSMAASHVTGALALLLSAVPSLGLERGEAALENGAVDLGSAGPDSDNGYGRLDVLGAYEWLTTAPDFALSATQGSASTVPGGTASFTADVTAINGFADDVALSVSGLDASQAAWTLTPPTIAGGSGTATLSVTASSSLAAGSYRLALTGTSGAVTRTVYLVLQVSPPPDFTLGVTPSSASTLPGGSVVYSIDVGSLNGFGGNVALSLSGLTPAQANWNFTPPAVAGSGRSSLTVTTTASLTPKTYPLVITGTSGTTTHNAAVNLVVVAPPDFTLAAAPSTQSAIAGSTFNYTVTAAAKAGFSGSVALSMTGLTASQAGWTFAPPSVIASGTSTLAVKTSSTLAVGTYKLTIKGTSGTLTHTVAVNLIVSAPPDFVLTASPSSATVTAGGSVTYTVSTASRGGFRENVTLALSGAPTGATATFTPNPVGTPASATLRVQTTGSTSRGTATLRVTGTSGALSHQVTLSLTVR